MKPPIFFFRNFYSSNCHFIPIHHLTAPEPPLTMYSVWIIGHSYIHWAQRYAAIRNFHNLDLPNVDIKWIGQRGLKCHQLLPLVKTFLHLPHPNLIILHCGGNDLGSLTGVGVEMLLKDIFGQLMALFPQTALVYSNICQRQKWKWSNQFCPQFEKARKHVNKSVSAYMRDHGMGSIYNNNLRYNMQEIYRGDGVHFSDEGNRIFLLNLRLCIGTYL